MAGTPVAPVEAGSGIGGTAYSLFRKKTDRGSLIVVENAIYDA